MRFISADLGRRGLGRDLNVLKNHVLYNRNERRGGGHPTSPPCVVRPLRTYPQLQGSSLHSLVHVSSTVCPHPVAQAPTLWPRPPPMRMGFMSHLFAPVSLVLGPPLTSGRLQHMSVG